MTLTYAEGLPTRGIRCDALGAKNDADAGNPFGHHFRAQKPYRNGVIVYTRNGWAGNGFGNWTEKVAVRNGEIVGVYESAGFPSHQLAVVVGTSHEITSDGEWMRICGKRERRVTKTAFHKWIAAIKAL
jgi:hypothetical protein